MIGLVEHWHEDGATTSQTGAEVMSVRQLSQTSGGTSLTLMAHIGHEFKEGGKLASNILHTAKQVKDCSCEQLQ